MMRLARRAEGGDHGAVAVIVAICAIVLFGVAAMAVDLGNGWSRKRSAQTDADFAALAGAAFLPDTATAISKAYDYLNTNLPRDDAGATVGPLSNYSDGVQSNGEITVSANNQQITVWVPRRRVNFGLAGAIGFNALTVNATATAAVKSPAKLLPFFLDTTCDRGSQILKDGNTAPNLFPADSPHNAQQPTITSAVVVPDPIPAATGGQITIVGTKLDPASVVVWYTNGNLHSQGTVLPTPPATTTTLTATVPPNLLSGTWYVQVATTAGGFSNDNPAQAPTFTVTNANCGASSTGDFGIIDSPRKPPPSNLSQSQDLDFNLALGIDHGIQCFPAIAGTCATGINILPPPGDKSCQVTPQIPQPGGIFDNDPTRDDANCLATAGGTGAAATTQGLITGGNDAGVSFTGRLQGAASPGCSGPPGGQNPTSLTVSGTTYSINNDVLSCFLEPGKSLQDLTNFSNTGVLSSAIADSPRFFIVPVLDETQPPQNNGFVPIVDFRGVFLTDETPGSAASPTNGITLTNSGQKISQLTVYVFSLNALPVSLANTGGTLPYLGFGPKVPVLIN
ncbi:MAG TPA: pilus assembly protein TadG-related protein [Mycobacteriales bacterium]|nr:pilus assembly protein TadG-related protein [Mycobacteriales bacterium]